MNSNISNHDYSQLNLQLEGHIVIDHLSKIIYATDASVYREIPAAVAFPKSISDIQLLINFATIHKTSLIPRAAGTSLAGQVVGDGIVVDVSKFMNNIIEFHPNEQWIKVQPGIIRDELNNFLKPHGLFFSPITSTANRATIGGMVGNNSSGTTSIEYGTTREHVLEIECVLHNGETATFSNINSQDFSDITKNQNHLAQIYKETFLLLNDKSIQQSIRENFPKSTIHRRNTGYALDYLIDTEVFGNSDEPFNFCKLMCGSEGTLAFITSVKIHLDPLPYQEVAVLAAHFLSIRESMLATQLVMKLKPSACELMDKIILDCTKENKEQAKNRYFVEGDPKAILMIEFRDKTPDGLKEKLEKCKAVLDESKLSYANPIIFGKDTSKVWTLRSAGLGLLANIPGDKKAVACIEDTAVDLDDLPNYIAEFEKLMLQYNQSPVYYAHAGAGEIHLRPILDLKKSADVRDFYAITKDVATLVKKYDGSLSGEHGDGRLRAEFIELMVGKEINDLFKKIKLLFDPHLIFNPGKIVNPKSITESLRYKPDQKPRKIDTIFDFHQDQGILQAAEKCNGSGDCRKLTLSGGTMCPSFQATRNEKDTTRARANTLREILTTNPKENPFDSQELAEVMNLCISCKACGSECPSNVDMSTLKAEFQYQYYKSHKIPLRTKVFGNISTLNYLGSYFPSIFNFTLKNKFTNNILKSALGIAKERSIPIIQKESLKSWFKKNYASLTPKTPIKNIYFFADEFTDFNDTHIGIKAIKLLAALQYNVILLNHQESGRAAISKGLLDKAKKHANFNTNVFWNKISENSPLIGIEPSAILSFRDEYPKLVDSDLKEKAKYNHQYTYLIEEFLANEIKLGNMHKSQFTSNELNIKFHAHCHQKSLGNPDDSMWIMAFPGNYNVEHIPSGCCGMAGSFGFEKEHFEISQQIGELVLFPTIRNAQKEAIIAANGTSCRHQIHDGLQRTAVHPIEILFDALAK